MTVGLFFGSFNPVHVGHMVIANYMREYAGIDQVWFVVSPHNPLKSRSTLLAASDRLHLVNIAIDGYLPYKACDIEFKMPQPSYTIDTLVRLAEKYPQNQFSLIMGSDNLETFHKWKNWEVIVENYHRYIYPRPGTSEKWLKQAVNATLVDAPLMEISSTFIRQAIGKGKSVPFFFPEKVYQYIEEMNFYKKTKQAK